MLVDYIFAISISALPCSMEGRLALGYHIRCSVLGLALRLRGRHGIFLLAATPPRDRIGELGVLAIEGGGVDICGIVRVIARRRMFGEGVGG